MTTNQLTTCTPSTSPPDRRVALWLIVPMLVVATSLALGVDVVAGEPWSLVRAIVRGPMQEHHDELGGGPLAAVRTAELPPFSGVPGAETVGTTRATAS